MGFTVGFTVGSVGFKRYLVSIIVTHCGIFCSTSQPPLLEDLHLLHSLWLKKDCAISACRPPFPRHASKLKHCYRACLQTSVHKKYNMSIVDQGSTSRKRSTPTRPATEQTPEIPADAEATMQDPGNASILRCSDSAVEPDAATEHIPPASFGSAGEASSGCGDMNIKSLDDVVSKLFF